MSLTILFDLDDTLLVNPVTDFLPAYLKALSSTLAPYIDPALVVQSLLEGTKRMVANRRPDCTLQDIFDDYFFPAVGSSRAALQEHIDHFYKDVFPTLKPLTDTNPAAIQVVEQSLQRGYKVVIATNPLFPRTAILQRLEWAGLSPNKYPFTFLPSIETVHFAKPNPAFLAELLSLLGWPEEPAIMVGDDLINDIATANQLGLPTYWISADGVKPDNGISKPTAHGSLNEFLHWIDRTQADQLRSDYDTSSALLAILRATPAALDLLCRGLNPGIWTKRPQPQEWCQTEIICHLRDVECEVNLPRLEMIVREPNPFLPGKDTDPWAEERKYIVQDGPNALQRFIFARVELLNQLDRLSEADWQRPARHSILGPTTLQEIVSIITRHDQLHLRQVTQVFDTLKVNRSQLLS